MNAQPKTLMHPPVMPMAASMSHMVAFADAIPILSTLSAKSLRHKGQLVLPLTQFVATLSRQLSWSHFVKQVPLKTEQARQFYVSQAADQIRSVRGLRQQIERKAFERIELASLQAPNAKVLVSTCVPKSAAKR